jgi:gelsolin
MTKTTKISWKDTNLALIGSELDHKIKQATAANEVAWVEGGGKNGIGKAPGLHVWRIEQFHVKAWPTEKYSQFHKGDSYIVLNSYRKGTSDALNHDVHIWIGQESSQDEYGTAAYKMVEADDYLGGGAIQHRQDQGHEDDLFKSYFEVMEYLEGGVESGFRHVEPDPQHPVLFQVKGGGSRVKAIMTLTQVPLSKSSLNAGDSFILYGGAAKVWCWHGASAKPLEKAHSNQWAEKMVC